jgi:hypothetical protein
MLIGLFLFAGWFIRLLTDVFDKTKELNFKEHVIWFVTAGVFYAIQAILQLEDNFTNEFAIAGYMLLLAVIGYLPGHFFDKASRFFVKKTDEKFPT